MSISHTLILGPCKSWIMPTGTFSFFAAILKRSTARWLLAWVPWEKLKRATFMPALIICVKVFSPSHAGPMVATILVRFMS